MEQLAHRVAPKGVPQKAWAKLTRFQQQVYRAICRIPKGQTRPYQWVARAIGYPRAARAVGNALNHNPCLRRACPRCSRRGRQAFAPCIPCHRILRADGSLGGYSGGLAKKRRLLAAEKRSNPC